MGAVHLSLLTFLLNPWIVLSIQGLNCVNDYINNITCVWNSSAVGPGVVCHLQGQKANNVRRCDLKPLLGSDGTLRGCHLVFVSNQFIFRDKIPLNVTCNNSTVVRIPDYSPAKNIKMHPPGRPTVLKSNMSWSPGHPLSPFIFDKEFQIQFKLEKHGWEVAQNIPSRRETWLELNEDKLEKAVLYQARVRVRPVKDLSGVWSDWSPTTSWRSEEVNLEVNLPPTSWRSEFAKIPPSQGFTWSVEVSVVLVLSFMLMMILMAFLCCTYQEKWFYQVKCLHIPDPSKYFASLHSIHEGNFQKWLSPMFSPESFDILRNSEDISVLEISKEKVVTPAYLEFSNLAKQWDSSGHSTFSNLGYLYSKYPSSYEIEPCSVYFSYQPGEECGDDGSYEPSLQTSSSYECLAKEGDFRRHVEVPDSGFGTGQEDQEMEENEEEKVELSSFGESAHWPAPLVACPSSRAVVCPASSSQPFHSFPWPPNPYPISRDLGLADRPSAPVESFGITPGRFSSAKLEPSNGGYLSLQDMELPGGNKSI